MKMFKILFKTVFLLIIITCLAYVCVIGENLDSRIIGGVPADKKSWPFMAILTYGRKAICGGSLIHPLWILTAGHCVSPTSAVTEMLIKSFGPLGVRLGTEDIQIVSEIQIAIERPPGLHATPAVKEAVQIEKTVIHPEYKEYTSRYASTCVNDVALLKLPENYKLPGSVKLTELATTPVEDQTSCKTAGWGVNKFPFVFYKTGLQEIELFIDTKMCEQLKKDVNDFLRNVSTMRLEHIICGKAKNTSETPYKGDSGGPVVCNNKLQGVLSTVSASLSGTQINFETIYTDLIPYTKWIQEVTGIDETGKRTMKSNAPTSYSCTVILSMMNIIYLLSRISQEF